MAIETLHADAVVTNSGCLDPQNAQGAPDAIFTTNTTNTNWTCNWALSTPTDPLTPNYTTHQATVRLRRSAAGGNDPTVQVDLYNAGVLVKTLVPAGTPIIGDTAQDYSATFSTAEITDPTAIEMFVSATGSGGSTNSRRNIQVDAFTMMVDTSVVQGTNHLGSLNVGGTSNVSFMGTHGTTSAVTKQGLHFDGIDDRVTFGTYPEINDTFYDRTVQVLFRCDDVQKHSVIVETGGTYTVAFQVSGGNLIGVAGTTSGNTYMVHPIENATLYHASIKLNSALSTITMLVNGIEVTSESTGTQVNGSANPNALGGPNGAWNKYNTGYSTEGGYRFPGDIFRVWVWNFPRANEQLNDPLEALTGSESGLILLYDMEEGSGSTLTNSFATGTSGTIEGATWTSTNIETSIDHTGTLALAGTSSVTFTATQINEAGFSVNNTAAQNHAAYQALSNTSTDVVLPNGDYPMAAHPIIDNFTGSITMLNGSRIVFEDSSGRGAHFRTGGSAKLYNYHHAYAQPVPEGNPVGPNALTFNDSIGVILDNVYIDGSPSAGIVFYGGSDMQVLNTEVINTGRDALHFDKCVNPYVDTYKSTDSTDDGLAFVNHGGTQEDATGGTARNIEVVDARNTRGIVSVGHSNILIEDFTITNTHASGLYLAQELAYDTPVPINITARNGTIQNAGQLLVNGNVASHRHSVFLNKTGTGIRLENISSINPGGEHYFKNAEALEPEVLDVNEVLIDNLTIASTSNLALAGTLDNTGTIEAAGSSALSLDGVQGKSSSLLITSNPDVLLEGTRGYSSELSLVGTSSATFTGTKLSINSGTLDIRSDSLLSLSGRLTKTGELNSDGSSTLSLDGILGKSSIVELDGTSSVNLSGERVVSDSLQVDGASDLTVNGVRGQSSSFQSNSTSDLVIHGIKGQSTSLRIDGTAGVTFTGQKIIPNSGTLDIRSNSTLELSGNLTKTGSLQSDGMGTLALQGDRILNTSIALDGSSSFTLTGVVGKSSALQVDSTGVMTLVGIKGSTGALDLTGTSDVTLAATLLASGSFVVNGTSSILLRMTDTTLRQTSLQGTSLFQAVLSKKPFNLSMSIDGTSNIEWNSNYITGSSLPLNGFSDVVMDGIGATHYNSTLSIRSMSQMQADPTVDWYGSFLKEVV